MASITWAAEIAEVYDKTYAAIFEPSVLDPMVGVLAELALGGPAVEFAVGTGRVALALSDLMARITGFRVRDRWAGWDRAPSTSDSPSQVAVFEKLPLGLAFRQ